jgi:hypothetical protein
MKKAKEIIEILNAVDENVKLEAKRGSSIDKSVMESWNSKRRTFSISFLYHFWYK